MKRKKKNNEEIIEAVESAHTNEIPTIDGTAENTADIGDDIADDDSATADIGDEVAEDAVADADIKSTDDTDTSVASNEDTIDSNKPKKEKKAKKEKPVKASAPKSNVNSVLIFIIILLAGLGIAGFAVRTVQLNNANEQLASATDANEDYKIKVERYEKTIANNETDIAELETSLDEANSTLTSLKEDLGIYESSVERYASYNGLINYFNKYAGTSTSSFFASDSILHMTKKPVEVYIHVDGKTNLNYVIDNKNIASCDWIGWANDNVAILKVTPGKTIGETVITLTDEGPTTESDDADSNDDSSSDTESDNSEKPTIKIYVYND